jgi:hypothetical protein
MKVKSYCCRVTAPGALTLPAALFSRLQQAQISNLNAGFKDGHAVLDPLDRVAAALIRISPVLGLIEADFQSAEEIAESDFSPTALRAFSIGLDTPVLGTVTL